jgi:hypothetical protein
MAAEFPKQRPGVNYLTEGGDDLGVGVTAGAEAGIRKGQRWRPDILVLPVPAR